MCTENCPCFSGKKDNSSLINSFDEATYRNKAHFTGYMGLTESQLNKFGRTRQNNTIGNYKPLIWKDYKYTADDPETMVSFSSFEECYKNKLSPKDILLVNKTDEEQKKI
jgi:hypothetical protein